jgi:hypothetical protein
MDRRRLRIYLNDHLAASAGALARTRATIRANRDSKLATELQRFLDEATEDRRVLLEVMDRLGLRRARLKELAALGAERMGRLKLNGRWIRYSPLSRLEELEFLAAGASLKGRLWETLEILSEEEAALDADALEAQRKRARAQERSLSRIRRKWVHEAFS